MELSSPMAMALHSMCQPGRPGPNGEGQDGSSGRDGCHSTKSSRLRCRGSSGVPPPSADSFAMAASSRPESPPKPAQVDTSNQVVPSAV